MKLLSEQFPQLIQSISLPTNLELNAPGATKGDALEALCRHLGLDLLEAAAFGDGTNDLTMIQKAGVGVAMANARPGRAPVRRPRRPLQPGGRRGPDSGAVVPSITIRQTRPSRGYGGKL